jgi:putative heme-binding domain-containing protein
MPHIGSEIVDDRGLQLIHDWIRQLPMRKDERVLLDKLRALDELNSLASEKTELERELARLALEVAKENGREFVIDADREKAKTRQKALADARAGTRASARRDTIQQLLASTSGALLLAHELDAGRLPESIRPQLLQSVAALNDTVVLDLFERYLPEDKRLKRLGTVIKPDKILALKGDAARGKLLFFKSATLQCINCHRVNGTGSTLGPDLTQIAKKYSRAQILESILEPSKSIDPKYVKYLVELTDGKVQDGLLAEKNDREVVLKTLGDKEIRIPAAKILGLHPQKDSIMPELLLRDLTAEQAADLLEFLASLK